MDLNQGYLIGIGYDDEVNYENSIRADTGRAPGQKQKRSMPAKEFLLRVWSTLKKHWMMVGFKSRDSR
jgi:hypothetical protein